jgi:hypothetical protein
LADRFISGWPPSITARYFSSCPSDSTSRWTPCPPENRWLMASGPPWLVSGFHLRARLGFSIPFTFSGPRGVTPAFGYSAPHPSARGTSTLLSNALLSAHCGPLRHPRRPSLSLTSCQLIFTDHRWGFPCCVWSPCLHAVATTPAGLMGSFARSIPSTSAFPELSAGRLLH